MVDQVLMKLATTRVWADAGGPSMEKVAVVPPEPAMPPGGAPPGGAPMDPAMAGGAPPMDPMAMGGGMPMDPMAMGGMPPGGAPPMDPSMMGGMPGAAPGMPMDPAAGGGAAGQKMKPEQYMQMLDFRLYNLQQQLTTLMNSMDIKMDPGVLVTPPGAPMGPPPEAAMQGGPQDPGASAQPQGGGGGGSAISAIDPMQGASPELAMGGAGGGGMPGGEKMGGDALSFSDFIEHMAGDIAALGQQQAAAIKKANAISPVGVPYTVAMPEQAPKDNVAAAAAMMRSRTLAAAR